jgi:hypothetical protein
VKGSIGAANAERAGFELSQKLIIKCGKEIRTSVGRKISGQGIDPAATMGWGKIFPR